MWHNCVCLVVWDYISCGTELIAPYCDTLLVGCIRNYTCLLIHAGSVCEVIVPFAPEPSCGLYMLDQPGFTAWSPVLFVWWLPVWVPLLCLWSHCMLVSGCAMVSPRVSFTHRRCAWCCDCYVFVRTGLSLVCVVETRVFVGRRRDSVYCCLPRCTVDSLVSRVRRFTCVWNTLLLSLNL